MAIESRTTRNTIKRGYPKLMISRSGTIVQFKRYGVGQVVGFWGGSESNVNEQADIAEDWDMDLFIDYLGTVTLSNK